MLHVDFKISIHWTMTRCIQSIGLYLLLFTFSGCDSDESKENALPPLPDLGRLCETGCVDYSIMDMYIEVDAGLPQCNDEIDNDGDGQIDGFDDGCSSPDDDDERSPDQVPACSD